MSRNPAQDHLVKLVRERFELIGDLDTATRSVIGENNSLAIEAIYGAVKKTMEPELKRAWLTPNGPPPLVMEGQAELWVPDRVVRVDDEYKSRRRATFAEAIASDDLRRSHHVGQAEVALRDRRQEEFVRDQAAEAGLDVDTKTWDELALRDVKCWRCGEGVRVDDPFEHGHVGLPGSKGGDVTAWEHFSCNRQARGSVTYDGDI